MTMDREPNRNDAEWLAADRAAWTNATTPDHRRYLGDEVDTLHDLALRINRIPKFQGLPQGSALPKVRVLCAKGHLIFKAHAWLEYTGNLHQDGREVPSLEFVVDEMAVSASGVKSTISDSTPYIPEKWIRDLAKTDDELGEHRSVIHCSLCPRSQITVRESYLLRRYAEAVILGKRSMKIDGAEQR